MQLLDYLVKVTVIVSTAFSVGCSIQYFSKPKQVNSDLILFDGKVRERVLEEIDDFLQM